MTVWAVVLAAGSGARFGGFKQFEEIGGRRGVDWSVANARGAADGVVMALPPGVEWTGQPVDRVVVGGTTHAESTRNALAAVPDVAEVIVMMSASHPITSAAQVTACVSAVRSGAEGAFPGLEYADAVVSVASPRTPVSAVESLARGGLRSLQLPMAFDADLLQAAIANDVDFVEEVQAVAAAGGQFRVVKADPHNIHVTTPLDIAIAERLALTCPGLVAPWPTGLASVDRSTMARVDDLAVNRFGPSLLQMMENAGRALADLAIIRWRPRSVTVLCGKGGNGGGAMAAARHLVSRGVEAAITMSGDSAYLSPAAESQRAILDHTSAQWSGEPTDADLIIDGLIGYSLNGPPTGRPAELIDWANGASAPVLSLDSPSGLDVTTGATPGAVIEAAATLTLALPKVGLIGSEAVGTLFLADIGIPSALYGELGIPTTLPFGAGGLIRL